jgi:DNA-binding response OmpR family regulator
MTDILLVEDNPAHAELIMRYISDHAPQYSLDHVDNGEKALDYMFGRGEWANQQNRPGLILLDIQLPGVDGHDVLKSLKEAPEISSIPVIMLTTSSSQRDVVEALDREVEDYLVKPFGPEALKTVQKWLDK